MQHAYGRLICKINESIKSMGELSKEIKQNYLFSMRRVTTVQVLAVGFVAVGEGRKLPVRTHSSYYIY